MDGKTKANGQAGGNMGERERKRGMRTGEQERQEGGPLGRQAAGQIKAQAEMNGQMDRHPGQRKWMER